MQNPYRPVCWITHPDCGMHNMGALHPESLRRLDAIEDRLQADVMGDFLQRLTAPME